MNICTFSLLIILICLICKRWYKIDKFVNYIDPTTIELHPSLEGTKRGELLKKHQQNLTHMFKEFIEICDTNKLNYILIGGTLIGTLRHKGWIPWDDDIDVAMFRDDQLKIKDIYVNDPYLRQQYKVVPSSNIHVWIDLYKIISRTNSRLFIDIFLLKERDDKPGNYGIVNYKGYRPFTNINNILPTKNAYFEGIKVKIPNDPLKVLKEILFRSAGTPDINNLPPIDKRKPHH